MVDSEQLFVKQFLRPMEIPGKESLYHDIEELGDSIGFFLGEKYQFSCELVRETERLLVNAVSLFEKGYFDAAFYLLRESIEVSTTFVYLYDLPDERRAKEYAAWKSETEGFKMHGGMLRELDKYGSHHADFKAKMPAFFAKQHSAYNRLNKFVHKQGFSKLYIARWRLGCKNGPQRDKDLLKEFLSLASESIGIAAVSRLMIDPMPLLLGSEEFAYRLGDVLGEPFSPAFIKQYIGDEIVAQYKTTRMYNAFREDILAQEKLSEEAYIFVKYNIFDRKDIPIITKQSHLLSFHHWVVLDLAARYEEIIAIYLYDGLLSFRTDTRREHEREFEYSSSDFKEMREGSSLANIPFKDAFITVVRVNGCDFFLEYENRFDAIRLIDLHNFAKRLDVEIKAIEEKSNDAMMAELLRAKETGESKAQGLFTPPSDTAEGA